jgi:hypothetical protein
MAFTALARSLSPVTTMTLVSGARVRISFERGQALGDAARVRRQTEVQQHHAGLMTAQGRDRRLAVAGHNHLVAVKGPAQLALQAFVVLDH